MGRLPCLFPRPLSLFMAFALFCDPGATRASRARVVHTEGSLLLEIYRLSPYRVSIINHLHCNRTVHRRSDTEASRSLLPRRRCNSTWHAESFQSATPTVTMEMRRIPKCCHLSYPRDATRIARASGEGTCRRRERQTRIITPEADPARCVAPRCIALHHTLLRGNGHGALF